MYVQRRATVRLMATVSVRTKKAPKKGAGDRIRTLAFRLSLADEKNVKKLAKEAGVPVSQWIRERACTKE